MTITVYTARQIRTMDPSLPPATALAVRGDRIVEVGTLESLRPWLDLHEHEVDDRFADSVLLPGLIDPHVHPSLMAALMPPSGSPRRPGTSRAATCRPPRAVTPT